MPKKRSKLQNEAELLVLRSLLGAIGAMPLQTSIRFGKSFGKFLAKTFPKLQKTARRNLEIALPELSETEKERIVHGTFESLGRHLGFVSHFRKFELEDIRNLIEVVGKEHFDEAHASGRGVLFFTGHFGSWEVFNLLPPAFGYGMNILVRRLDNLLIENFVDEMRTRFGSTTLDKTKSARTMFRVLKNGGLLGILADLNVQEKEGVFVDFFGIATSTTTSIAKLALATNAAVLPAFAVWDEARAKYVVYLEPPVEYEKTENTEEDVRELTQKITKVVEKYVRKYPEQWLWIHKRWNTRPAGEKGLY
ncbi:MAG: lysophospholipid acyltransferase family protein [Acidobacteria bacterium]|nr:lysophospholipid acyltransferase family protein [Acidobacteriota bacterium]MCA1637604.1 lysophospholipid acyltransferase family protein [Acidobacteriota bacterium]